MAITSGSISGVAGDTVPVTKSLGGVPTSTLVVTAWLTIKNAPTDAAWVKQKVITTWPNVGTGQITDPGSSGTAQFSWEFTANDTTALGVAQYFYDIRVRFSNGDIATVEAGTLRFTQGVTMSRVATPKLFSNLVAWYAADAITGLSDGAGVAQWNDLSGHANHLTQVTGANQPLYRSGVQYGLPAGLPAVLFDGANDFLSNSTMSAQAVASYTLFCVVWNLVADDALEHWAMRVGNISGNINLDWTTNNKYNIGGTATDSVAGPAGDQLPHVIVAYMSTTSGNAVLMVDSQSFTGTVDAGTTGPYLYLGSREGAARWWNGYIMEAGFYAQDIGAVARAQLMSSLRMKYGI